MRSIVKHSPHLLRPCCCRKHINIKQISNAYLGPSGFKETNNVIKLKNFPNSHLLFAKYCQINKIDDSYKYLSLNELLREFGVNSSIDSLPKHRLQREYILTVDINVLMKHGLLTDISTSTLLGHLDPFPYKKPVWNGIVTINTVRNSIEEQYLAWKLKADIKFIKYILSFLKQCLYVGRSLRNLRRNLTLLKGIEEVKTENVANLIYLINIRPFSKKNVIEFKEKFYSLPWEDAAFSFPKVMSYSYFYIRFLFSILKNKGFSDEQIMNGLPAMHFFFTNLLSRLDFLLESPELSSFKSRRNFLMLLSYSTHKLKRKITSCESDSKLMEQLFERKVTNTRSFKSIHLHYALYIRLKISNQVFENLKKHSKFYTASMDRVDDTLNYLEELKFTKKEIFESITIILYPRANIKASLQKMIEAQEKLAKIGFKNGIVPAITNDFAAGTKLRNKVLQLCLYYMEKDHSFSGDGVFLSQAYS